MATNQMYFSWPHVVGQCDEKGFPLYNWHRRRDILAATPVSRDHGPGQHLGQCFDPVYDLEAISDSIFVAGKFITSW